MLCKIQPVTRLLNRENKCCRLRRGKGRVKSSCLDTMFPGEKSPAMSHPFLFESQVTTRITGLSVTVYMT